MLSKNRPAISRFDILGLLAIGGWLFLMVRLGVVNAPVIADGELEISAEQAETGFRAGEEWHGLYHRDDKIGFVRVRRSLADGLYRLESWTVLRLTVLGQEHQREINMVTELDRDFILRSFEADVDATGQEIRIVGSVEDRPGDPTEYQLSYELMIGDVWHSDTLVLPEAPLLQIDLRRSLLLQNPQEGDRYEANFFDPMSQQQQPLVVEYDGIEAISVLGETVSAHRIIQYLGNQTLTVWINDIGEVLKEEYPLGIVSLRESRGAAMYGILRGGEVTTDLVQLASIETTPIDFDLTEVDEVSWTLGGVTLDPYDLDGGRQTASPLDGQVSVAIRREPTPPPMNVSDLQLSADLAEHTTSEVLIQSDSEAIRDRATLIAGSRSDVEHLAREVGNWVHLNMTRESAIGIPSALEVLGTMRGDCNEHATLATALLRALGIPSRVATGIAYQNGYFYYHAWVEYWNGQWRTLDPTWGQIPADLGHIRLVSGGLDRQLILSNVFGEITVEVSP